VAFLALAMSADFYHAMCSPRADRGAVFPDPPAKFCVRAKEFIKLTGFRGGLRNRLDNKDRKPTAAQTLVVRRFKLSLDCKKCGFDKFPAPP